MSFSPDDKRFLDLLQQWQTGDFTRLDEQELQRLVQNDAFRQEALEGFLLQPDANHRDRLQALRLRLQAAGAVRRTIFPQITAAAAVLLLLITAVWFFRNPPPDPAGAIAQTETTLPETRNPSDAALPAAPSEKQPDVSDEIAAATPPVASPRSTLPPQEYESPKQRRAAENNLPDLAQAPVAAAPVTVAAESDEAKDIAAEEADRIMDNMVFQENKALEDSENAKKASKSAAKPARSLPGQQGAANAMQDIDLEMATLQEYLRRNARLPEAARQNNVSGFVQISFELNKNRKPVNFKILRPLGYGCDEAAIRLLEAYNWRDFEKDEVLVEVPFVR